MNKFKKLLLLFTLTYQSFLWAECSDEDKNSQIKLADGEIKLDEKTSLGFKSAELKNNETVLTDVEIYTCDKDAVWKFSADEASLKKDKSIQLKKAKVTLFDIPIFWVNEVNYDDKESISIPSLGLTDNEIDISYKFQRKYENSSFVLEPVYTKSKFGASFKYQHKDDDNNYKFTSLALNDDDGSWVYKLIGNSLIGENITFGVNYSDFSGQSLIQNYGYRYLDASRRSLDLRQSINLSYELDNLFMSFGSDDFKQLGIARPVSHRKDYLTSDLFFDIGQFRIDLVTEFAKFKDKSNKIFQLPYSVYDNVERFFTELRASNKYQNNKIKIDTDFLVQIRDYSFKDKTIEGIQKNDFAFSQNFSFPEIKGLKLGVIVSSYEDQSEVPILDSYPRMPTPESNISLQPWSGKDRGPNQNKLFIFHSGSLSSFDYSVSTNLYEDYNFSDESMIFKKFYEKKPIFFKIQKNAGNFSYFTNGNYSVEKEKFMGLRFGIKYSNQEGLFSLEKNEFAMASFPLSGINNYVLKAKQKFGDITLFTRAQYSQENEIINESVIGGEWFVDCLKLRLSLERARFFPYIDPDNINLSYMQIINLTNPQVKNNLSFEFELIGLSNILNPVENIIENGLFN